MVKLIRTKSTNPDFRHLIQLLDKDLWLRNGEGQAVYAIYNKIDYLETVVIAYVDDSPVGCGCFKIVDTHTVELKRMFVRADHRGKGIAFKIVDELERWAGELTYTHVVLETGKEQVEAIHLYKKVGYQVIENYGPYVGMANSICMRKGI